MASETITRNDLTTILNEVLPPTPSEYKKLLWQNLSPTSEFSPQTVTLDLSDYDEVEVFAGFTNSDASTNMCGYFRAKVGGAGLIQLVNLDTTYNASAATFINIVSRQFQVSTTGVTFANGQMAYAGSAYVNWSGRAVPFAIYGIKYERVNPPQVEFPNYSTDEQEVGTWVDGKTIYRKVYLGLNFGGTASAWTDTGATLSGVDKIVNCRALNLSGVIQALMGFRIYNNKIQYYCAQTWSGTTCIIIEYTKN